jgi:hypothetical protein
MVGDVNEDRRGTMTLDPDPTVPRRCATLRLRGPAGPLGVRVYWPRAVWPPLLVLFGAGSSVAARLCVRARVVVLAAEPADAATARTVLDWAVDHRAELDAAAPTLLAGWAFGAPVAAGAAARAGRDGWPPLQQVLLVPPALSKTGNAVRPSDEAVPLTGQALATTVIAPGPDALDDLGAAIARAVSPTRSDKETR